MFITKAFCTCKGYKTFTLIYCIVPGIFICIGVGVFASKVKDKDDELHAGFWLTTAAGIISFVVGLVGFILTCCFSSRISTE